MLRNFVFLIVVFAGLHFLNAQISTPPKRKYNMGVYLGANVRLIRPFASLDLTAGRFTLRLMPNYQYYAAGITAELAQFSKVFYNHNWLLGFNAGRGVYFNRYDKVVSAPDIKSNYTTYQLHTGLKTYFKSNFYTILSVGASRTEYVTDNFANEIEYLPYIEAGIGIHFWKSYPKLKAEETED
ncbi:MAG: hypothetical protein MUF42_05280 [Cytophagaceae bacterium]|jgi:hypothetical protein|nr:hypothetical protein [Cytophagaceae bacterium]